MKKLQLVLKGCNPFSGKQSENKVLFCIQKVLAFLLIYGVASVIMEGIIIAGFSIMGYDVLHGELPVGDYVNAIPLYGFIGFILCVFLYVKIIEKEKLREYLFTFHLKQWRDYIIMFLAGGGVISVIIGCVIGFGGYRFQGVGSFKWSRILLMSGGYLVQAFAEETMCRGYLQNRTEKVLGRKIAIALSAGAFLLPHLSTIMECEWKIAAVSIINVVLVSIFFSYLMIVGGSVLASAGFHAGWNLVLNLVWGLTLTGGKEANGIFSLWVTRKNQWLIGGSYGIEASIFLIPVLLVLDIVIINVAKRKERRLGGDWK